MMHIEEIESHSILPDLVRRGGLVLDCGANLGAFSMEMIRRFDCRCYAFEASPVVFRRMPRHSNLIARNVAICGADRMVALELSEDITRNKISIKESKFESFVRVGGRHLAGIAGELGISDIEVLKLDIEGAELEVIDSLDDEFFRRISQITVEFHDFLGYATTQEVFERIERLKNIGFWELYWSRRRNTGDVLLVNRRRLGRIRYLYEQQIIRRLRAFVRLWRRQRSKVALA